MSLRYWIASETPDGKRQFCVDIDGARQTWSWMGKEHQLAIWNRAVPQHFKWVAVLQHGTFEDLRKNHAYEWACRIMAESESGHVPEITQLRGCSECAGYGKPGWVVEEKTWRYKKCVCWRDENADLASGNGAVP